LDNCEHVLDAAAALADTLLAACPDLRVLSTSRQPLGVDGEITWRVPSLAVPDDNPAGIVGLSSSEAVQLFAERAGRARAGVALAERNAQAVAEICRRLDGIPLAIELAAARVRVFTPAQIAAGLNQRFQLLTGAVRTALPRRQTLEASVDWSHHMLTHPEQVVFRRLAVFAGSFSFDAAKAVCAGDEIEPHRVLDLLALLIDKSLVQVDDDGDEARYRLLETVRYYAAQRLITAGEETAARDRHRDHYLVFAETAEPHLEGSGQTEWIARVAQDYPNLRAALEWSRDRGDAEPLVTIAAGLSSFWYFHGPNGEGETWLEAALGCDRVPALIRAKALDGRCHLASGHFDATTMARRGEEGRVLARQLGDLSLQSRMLVHLGFVAALKGQPAALLDEALALARQAEDRFAMVFALLSLGVGHIIYSPPTAWSYFEEAARIADQAGNAGAARIASSNLGWVMWYQGDLMRAKPSLNQAIESAREAGDRYTLAQSLFLLAGVLAETEERAEALETTRLVEVTAREAGVRLWDCNAPLIRSQVALSSGDQAEALHYARDAVERSSVPQLRAGTLLPLIEAEIAAGLAGDASGHADEVFALCQAGRFRYFLAYLLVLKARLARASGDLVASETTGHQALNTALDVSAKSPIVDALEELAGVAAELESLEEAARLFGAGAAIREATGYARCVSERDHDLASLRKALGNDAFQSALDQGQALSLDGAVAYARRGRVSANAHPPDGPA
jgi:predicted ATPase